MSQSNLEQVKQYIANQEEHHRKMNFQDELRELLGRKIDRSQLDAARALVTAGDAIDQSIETARGHAADASAVLASTSALDAEVVDGLTRLVDTLVTRQF